MSIELGSGGINKIYLGNTEIKKVYLGSDLIYDKTAAGGFLFDTYPAFFGISNRQLKTGATDVIKVREGGLNVEQGFTQTEITDGTLTTFTGTNDGLVVEPIDQANGFVVEQTIAADQPKIVDGGALVTSGGKPAWDNANGEGWRSSSVFDLTDINEIWAFNVIDFAQNAIIQTIFSIQEGQDGRPRGGVLFTFRETDLTVVASTNGLDNDYVIRFPLPTNGKLLISIKFNRVTGEVKVWYNGVEQTIIENTPFPIGNWGGSTTLRIIVRADDVLQPFLSKAQEFIIYKGDQSANRAAIEANINAHYNIY